ncbi:MAG: DUF2804 domain-containing protein [Alphaproteobacteria bacterium]
MTTEPEISSRVELCLPDGRTLNPLALGWSRTPLHRTNLRGGFGRTKRWDYWAVLAGDVVFSIVYANVDYLGIVATWWADLATGESGGREVSVPLARGVALPEDPGTAPLRWSGRDLDVAINDDPTQTRMVASWKERDGRASRCDVVVDLPPGHESVNVVIPWSSRRFQYTSKHQARPARGTLEIGGRRVAIGGDAGDAWGVLDVGRGRWPYRTRWNWGGGAGRSACGRHVVGLQVGGKWTEGTGFTENGVIVEGRVTKLGDELAWDYSWGRPMQPWRLRDPGGRLDLVLEPRFDRHSKVEALVLGTEVHQVFGRWSGRVVDDAGREIALEGIQGFAEESRSRW